jgi:hypothetical protein
MYCEYPMKTTVQFCSAVVYRPFIIAIANIVLITALSPNASTASVIASHSGSTDPTSPVEGWATVLSGGGVGVMVGPVTGDTMPAWFVDDTSTGAALFYQRIPTSQQVSDATTDGWILSATIRVPSSGRPQESHSPFLDFSDGTTLWTMGFDVIGGNTVVQLITGYSNLGNSAQASIGPTHTVMGTSAYNTFELRFDPLTLTADLFVNGTEQISNYGGTLVSIFGPSGVPPRIAWGAGSSLDLGRGHFNAVTFSTRSAVAAVPEAKSLLIWFGLVAVSIAVCRRSSMIE